MNFSQPELSIEGSPPTISKMIPFQLVQSISPIKKIKSTLLLSKVSRPESQINNSTRKQFLSILGTKKDDKRMHLKM